MRGYETSATLHMAVIGLSLDQNGLELATTHCSRPERPSEPHYRSTAARCLLPRCSPDCAAAGNN
jgi:hypothetical protein